MLVSQLNFRKRNSVFLQDNKIGKITKTCLYTYMKKEKYFKISLKTTGKTQLYFIYIPLFQLKTTA